MAKPFRLFEVGTTPQFTWTGSTAPSSLSYAIKTATGTLVASGPAVQSGGGGWYAFTTIPDSFGTYPVDLMIEWTATASVHTSNSAQFINRMVFSVKKTAPFGRPGN